MRCWSAGSAKRAGRIRCLPTSRFGTRSGLERKRLRKLRDLADVHDRHVGLHGAPGKALVTRAFPQTSAASDPNINLLSFGYKNGIPLEADLLFDARFLPNPFFVSRLKGAERPGQESQRLPSLLSRRPRNLSNGLRIFWNICCRNICGKGKSYLTIAVGCTGGRHRSVFVVEELARILKNRKAGHPRPSSGRENLTWKLRAGSE